MRKVLIGLIFGFVIAMPAVVVAANGGKAVFTISPKNGKVERFDDGWNRCYVAKTYAASGSSVSISCVRKGNWNE